jgi:hypothetical protein
MTRKLNMFAQRSIPLIALLAVPVAAPVAAQTGWTVDTRETTTAMVFGKPETPNAFRLDCSGGKMSLSTWTSRLPRNVTEGEFPTRLSVFQGNREIVLGGTGRVLPAGGTRVDALVANRQSLLEGMGRNSRLVVVSFAGRATAPAPEAALLGQFTEACLKR